MSSIDHAVGAPLEAAGGGGRRPLSISGRERLLLAVLLTASFTLAVDFSILNVALPAIGADVGFSLDSLQ